MIKQGLWSAALLAAVFGAEAARASPLQPFTVTVESAMDLGSVTAAAAGDTVFRVDPASGAVSRISGAGARASAVSARALVRIACAEAANHACDTAQLTVQVAAAGSPTVRARALANFTVAMGTASLVTPPGGGSSITFVIGPVGEGQSKTFYLGADVPIAGDDSGPLSGPSTSGFLVTVGGITDTTPGQAVGQAEARVIRSLSMSRTANLVFGTVVKPLTGDGLVTLDPVSNTRTVIGGQGLGGTPNAAAFTVTGEANETISIGVPSTVTLGGPGSITVTTATSVTGSPSLQGANGAAGTYSFRVGGSFPISAATPTGAYTGSFVVTADYN